jgi:hypothetical protein
MTIFKKLQKILSIALNTVALAQAWTEQPTATTAITNACLNSAVMERNSNFNTMPQAPIE